MSFQLGVDGLLGFKNTLKMIEQRNYEAAAAGMLNSLWAKQTPERANRMAEQMRTGIWQFAKGT
jgi:lysozyme